MMKRCPKCKYWFSRSSDPVLCSECTSTPRRAQVGGDHYLGDVQPRDLILAQGLSWDAGNVVKYLCRYKQKGGLEDLRKAQHYLQLLMEHEYPGEGE